MLSYIHRFFQSLNEYSLFSSPALLTLFIMPDYHGIFILAMISFSSSSFYSRISSYICSSASTGVFRALPSDENIPVVEPDHPPQDPELCTVNTPVRDLQLLDIMTGC